MALAMYDARTNLTLAYDRHECDIDASMNDADETMLADPKARGTVVALALSHGRNHAPLVHDSRRASMHVISIG